MTKTYNSAVGAQIIIRSRHNIRLVPAWSACVSVKLTRAEAAQALRIDRAARRAT